LLLWAAKLFSSVVKNEITPDDAFTSCKQCTEEQQKFLQAATFEKIFI
jgi:hypothetical protein